MGKEERIRCNNCMTVFESDDLERLEKDGELIDACPKCKTDEYLMQPFEEYGKENKEAENDKSRGI